MQLITYLKNKTARLEASYYVHPHVSFVIHKGIIYTESEFNKTYPVDVLKIEFASKYPKGKNPNERKLLTF